ncbi:PRTase-like protein [Erysiphe pulchra]|uniref:PRTase-like protein n=1 Tax=Erysiphe pulchra TaxID=225359 RepID=A0A2S4PQD5_9PEZI|nr:PRTase-like protein [Erysiphe pulchra]
MVVKEYLTYNQEAAPRILREFKPQLIIAIGGGGYVPARILRSFLKQPGSPNIPIQAIGLSLYEELCPATNGPSSPATDNHGPERPGTKVTRTQWLDLNSLGDMQNLVGKRILIVDEVDDTRTTLQYAVQELEKDVETARQKLGGNGDPTVFSIFVLHNKQKEKKGCLPKDMLDNNRYLAARTIDDKWICYPWEAIDIDEHDRLANQQQKYESDRSKMITAEK